MLTAYVAFGVSWLVVWGFGLSEAHLNFKSGGFQEDWEWRRKCAIAVLCTPIWPLALCVLVVVGLFLTVSFVWRVARGKD